MRVNGCGNQLDCDNHFTIYICMSNNDIITLKYIKCFKYTSVNLGEQKKKSLYSGSSIMNRFSTDRKNDRYIYSLSVYQVMSKSCQTQNKALSTEHTLLSSCPTSILPLRLPLAFPGVEKFIQILLCAALEDIQRTGF